jgi:hypothetical protein
VTTTYTHARNGYVHSREEWPEDTVAMTQDEWASRMEQEFDEVMMRLQDALGIERRPMTRWIAAKYWVLRRKWAFQDWFGRQLTRLGMGRV